MVEAVVSRHYISYIPHFEKKKVIQFFERCNETIERYIVEKEQKRRNEKESYKKCFWYFVLQTVNEGNGRGHIYAKVYEIPLFRSNKTCDGEKMIK